VAGMRQQIRRFEPGLSGRFFKFDGRELPW
jgi:hypothetical protein